MKLATLLTNPRAWAIIIGALSIYLQAKGIIGEAEMAFIATIMGAFTVVETIDVSGDKKIIAADKQIEAAAIAAGGYRG